MYTVCFRHKHNAQRFNIVFIIVVESSTFGVHHLIHVAQFSIQEFFFFKSLHILLGVVTSIVLHSCSLFLTISLTPITVYVVQRNIAHFFSFAGLICVVFFWSSKHKLYEVVFGIDFVHQIA